MDVSRSSVVLDTTDRVLQKIAEDKDRDQDQCENLPSAFCAEQTWPTEEEMKTAQQAKRRPSDSEMADPDPGMVSGFKP